MQLTMKQYTSAEKDGFELYNCLLWFISKYEVYGEDAKFVFQQLLAQAGLDRADKAMLEQFIAQLEYNIQERYREDSAA